MKKVLRHWPLIIAVLILLASVWSIFQASLANTNGYLTYTYDDPYIHMAIAKNVTQHGVFGVDRYHFSSSTSSLLWVALLIGVYAVSGVGDLAPLALTLASAIMLVLIAYYQLHRHSPSPIGTLLVLLALIFVTPLPMQVFSGMEHLLHACVMLLYLDIGARILCRSDHNDGTQAASVWLIIIATLATLVRYESVFLTLLIGGLLLICRRISLALLLGAVSVAPVLMFGLYAQQQGWWLLPNSLMLKGAQLETVSLSAVSEFAAKFIKAFQGNTEISLLVVAQLTMLCFRLVRGYPFWEPTTVRLALVPTLTFLHMQFVSDGRFGRYESYLMALCLVTFGQVALSALSSAEQYRFNSRLIGVYAAAGCAALLLTLPFMRIVTAGLKGTPIMSRNIYEQQVQAAQFIKQFYEGQAVAAIDIGAINYFADVKSLDLWGLGDMEPAILKREHRYIKDEIAALTRQKQIQIAVVYNTNFGIRKQVPSTWVKVGEWTIVDNVICASDTIGFYAVDPAMVGPLHQQLQAFAAQLPPIVIQRRSYLEHSQTAKLGQD